MTTFKPDQRVRVQGRPVGDLDAIYAGCAATFIEYTKPHGFARVRIDGSDTTVLLHPESLTED